MSQAKICPQCGEEYAADQRFCPSDGSSLRLQDASPDLVGSIVADRYHVVRKLGEGGMGQVYLAEHVKMGRRSALKVMNPAMVKDADAISRFNREAANASRINHPNVAAVYDFGETGDGVIYLAMEYVDGPSLTQIIEKQGALPPLRAADITRQVAEALTVAHDMGIVHRDLKPDNIMLARTRDGGDLVKVVDFGIAKAADNAAQKVTKTGLVVGTPEYMSPEQLAGDALDGRSDIYALALVAFNMLTGQRPFPGETAQESLIMRLTDAPRKLAETKGDVSWTAEVQAVLDRALARDASRRHATASEFGRELFGAIEGMLEGRGTRDEGRDAGSGKRDGGRVGISPTVTVLTVPATRVRPARDADSAAPDGRRVRMLAAAAAIVLAVGGIGAMVMHGEGAPAKSAAVVAAATLPATPRSNGAPAGHSGRSGHATPQSPTRRKGVPGITTTHPGDESVGARIARIDALTDPAVADAASAGRAIAALDSLEPRVRTTDDDIHTRVLRARAEIELQHTGAACNILKGIEGRAKGTTWERTVTSMLIYACQ